MFIDAALAFFSGLLLTEGVVFEVEETTGDELPCGFPCEWLCE